MTKFEIKMPKLGESITEGTIVAWNVKVGDMIKEDDVLFEVNTAKVSAEVPSPVDGKIIELLFKEGDTVAVGHVVAIVDISGDASSDTPSSPATEKSQESTKADTSMTEQPKTLANENKTDLSKWFSPVVLAKASAAKIELSELEKIDGSGYENRVTKRDIERYIEKKTKGVMPTPTSSRAAMSGSTTIATPAPAAVPAPVIPAMEGDTIFEMDQVRKIISQRMMQSIAISAHVTSMIEVDVTNLVQWRNKHKDQFKKQEGVSLTFMPAIVESTVKALKEFPRLNACVDGNKIIERKAINMGIAVALPDGNLIVPVVKGAEKLNISGLAVSIDGIAKKARNNKLSPDDISGGTFTISNYGAYRSLFGTPIINQPEVAILGVGYIDKKPCVINTAEGGEVIAIRHKMYLSLSHDHRIIDGALGSMFLKRITDYLEAWDKE